MNAQAIADQLQFILKPLADTIEEASAWLTLQFMAGNACQLITNAPMTLQAEIYGLVGPAEM